MAAPASACGASLSFPGAETGREGRGEKVGVEWRDFVSKQRRGKRAGESAGPPGRRNARSGAGPSAGAALSPRQPRAAGRCPRSGGAARRGRRSERCRRKASPACRTGTSPTDSSNGGGSARCGLSLPRGGGGTGGPCWGLQPLPRPQDACSGGGGSASISLYFFSPSFIPCNPFTWSPLDIFRAGKPRLVRCEGLSWPPTVSPDLFQFAAGLRRISSPPTEGWRRF